VIIYRYIVKELFITLLALTSVIVAIFIINQFVHYIAHVAEGQYSMISLLQLMAVMVPLIAGYLIPLGLYLSIILVFGRWYVNQEMVVMQACGLGFGELLRKVLSFSMLVALFVGYLTLVVDPMVQRLNNKVLIDIAEQSIVSRILPQVFTPLGAGQTFYSSMVSRDHTQLHDVFLAEKQADGGWRITTAERAHEEGNTQWPGRYLILRSGGQLSLSAKGDTYEYGQFDRYGVRIDVPYKKISTWPEDAETSQLWPKYHQDPKVAAELQWRLSIPLSVILLALLAVPLSHIRPRQGQYGRIFPAISIYLVYANFLWIGRSWISDGKMSPEVGLWWVHGLLLLFIIAVYCHRWGVKNIRGLIGRTRRP
tara:strand:+ start:3018 stop:4118 length:1101 start_codon:yes stop_codon:yes gene_type:complete